MLFADNSFHMVGGFGIIRFEFSLPDTEAWLAATVFGDRRSEVAALNLGSLMCTNCRPKDALAWTVRALEVLEPTLRAHASDQAAALLTSSGTP